MERKNQEICCGSLRDRLPDQVSEKYPCFVAQNFETQNQTFYTIHDPLSHNYGCLIPELVGKQIRGCFHGWMILTNHPHNVMWSLWNPSTSKVIRLPPLILKARGGFDVNDDDDVFEYCCLSSPADDPNSVLLLTGTGKPNIVFCRLDRKRKKLRWTNMTYAKQLKNLTGFDGFLHYPTCSNRKVYAFYRGAAVDKFLIQVDIVVKDTEVVISFLPILKLPWPKVGCGVSAMYAFLKGSCTGELFCIFMAFKYEGLKGFSAIYLFKLDMTGSMMWEEMQDLNDAMFVVDNVDILYYPAIASELGGCIHIIDETGSIVNSYHVKDKTLSLSSLPFVAQASHVSQWAMLELCRLEGDYKQQDEDKDREIILRSVHKQDDDAQFISSTVKESSHLLNLPLDVLETIMDFCVGFEYLKFRATCRYCHLAAPLIRWGHKTASKRLQLSPLLMVFDKLQGIITFTDPIFGDNYFVKTPRELIRDHFQIVHSRDGWLLILKRSGTLVFFNPFTGYIHKLPKIGYLESYCFSSPPTSPDCMVVGFTTMMESHIYIHFVSRGPPSWIGFGLNFGMNDPFSFCFPAFHGPDVFALCNNGELDVFIDIGDEDYSWEMVVNESPTSCCNSALGHRFLVRCDQHHILVIVGENGDSVDVFKSNQYVDEKWEKVDGVGKHTIYIGDTTCLCIEAKTPKMENKIFFPRFRSKNGNIVFYSLDTRRYHTFNGNDDDDDDDDIQENFGDFFQTKTPLLPHAWIEPRWS